MTKKWIKGSVWWVALPENHDTHVQGATRPCVVVSDVNTMPNSGVVTLCPLSTKLDTFECHPFSFVGKKVGQVLCDQLTTVDVRTLGDYVGQLREVDMMAVDATLRRILAL